MPKEKMIKPRNGRLRCPVCLFTPHTNAKVGDSCIMCLPRLGHSVVDAGIYVVDKSTVLGPINAVKATGNPLLDAANILEVDGWVLGNFVCNSGEKCLAGAIRAASGLFPNPESESYVYAQKYVHTAAYKQARRRSERAMFVLATYIERMSRVSKGARVVMSEGYDRDEVLEVVTNYNDKFLNFAQGRLAVLHVLRRAAKNYNPRLRLPNEESSEGV